MSQTDVLLKYASSAAAMSDLMPYLRHTDFDLDRIIPDVKLWRNSLDGSDGTHTYLTGYFVLVSLPQVIPALRDNANVQFAVNRDDNTVLKTNVTTTVLNDIRMAPVFAGTNYPWGAWA